MSVTEQLIRFLVLLRYEDLPSEVVEATKRLILNTIAAALAGSGAPGVEETARLVKECGGKPEASVFLRDAKVPAQEAVMVNATMGRALDFDEFNIQTGVHAGATVVTTALAASELALAERGKNVSGRELIAAIVAGAELISRMRMVPDRCIGVSGWTGEVFGAFGAAATMGKLLGFTEEQMRNSLGLALSQAAGIAQTIYDGALATRLQQGLSARAGVLAARLAYRGITGAWDFLEGKAGFYPVYYRGLSYDMRRLLDGLGTDYRFLTMAIKPYPCCGFIMAPIENLMGIMRKHDLREDEVTEVIVYVNEEMYNTVCAPHDAKYRPRNEADAMFSLPYVLGTVIMKGDVWLDDFTPEAIRDGRRLAATKKIVVVQDRAIDEESKKLNLTLSLHSMEVRTRDGRTISGKVYHAKGFPQNPMTLEECAVKLRRCAPYAVKNFPEGKVDSLERMIGRLEDLPCSQALPQMLA